MLRGESVSEEKASPQFQSSVQLQSALMGLALAYKQKYGDEALEVTKTFTKQLGRTQQHQGLRRNPRLKVKS
jgi:hypothetical protein